MQVRSADRVPRPNGGVLAPLRSRWSAYPVIVRIYMSFAATLFIGQFVLLLPSLRPLADSIRPLIGDIVLPLLLFFVCMHLLTPGTYRFRVAACWAMLGVALVYAAIDTWLGVGRAESANPWLRHSPWRPAWMFGVPLFGMLLLLMPGTRKAMRDQDAV